MSKFDEFLIKNKVDIEKLKISSPFWWIFLNHFVNENGKLMEFDNHKFLMQPFQDDHPDIVTKKSAQCGWSVLCIFQDGYLAGIRGLNVIHTLPTQNVIKDFVTPKVNPLINNNKEFRDMVTGDSLALKQIGDRFVYFRGSFKETDAISISADVLMNDEYDRCDQYVLQVYQSRLQASETAWIRRFSNPSLIGFGVDELYEDSDQMHWFIKCPHCEVKQYMIWPDNIDQEKREYICRHCKGVLTNKDRQNGEWIPKYPNRTYRRGYWVSQMMVPYVPAGYIIDQSKKDPQFFHNFVLGLAYSEAELLVTRQSIINCLAPGDPDMDNMCIGVDNGVVKHYVMGTPNGIYKYGSTKSWDEIERLIGMCKYAVIDANPYPNYPERLCKKYPGKVFRNYYTLDSKNEDSYIIDRKDGKFNSDRTRMMDSIAYDINNKEVLFFLTATQLDDYIDHWQNTYRGEVVNTQGIRKGVWLLKQGKPDHYVHAHVYLKLALSQTLTKKGTVVTPKGPAKKETSPMVSKEFTIPVDVDPVHEAFMTTKKQKGWKER